MRLKTVLAAAAWLSLVGGAVLWPTTVRAGEGEDALDKAIELFDQGKYTEAQQALLQINADQLDEQLRALRSEYLDRTKVAITMVERAKVDLQEADEAINAEQYDKAKTLLDRVLENEYATVAQRSIAVKQQKDVAVALEAQQKKAEAPAPPAPEKPQAEKTEAAAPPPAADKPKAEEPKAEKPKAETPPPPPAAEKPAPPKAPAVAAPAPAAEKKPVEPVSPSERAQTLVREGNRALDAGQVNEAARLFEQALDIVPGHPDATEGLERARTHGETEAGSRSLIDRVNQRRTVTWNRTVQQYREAERTIQEAVLAKQFEQARQSLLAARQIIEAGRQYAVPLVKYESLLNEYQSLAKHVDDEEQRVNEERVRQQRSEIQQQEMERQKAVADSKDRQVQALLDQAFQLRKDRNFVEAVKVLDQIIAIDPRAEQAKWLRDDLQDAAELQRQRKARDELGQEQQALLGDVEEAKIPWHGLLKYPDDWLEITNSADRINPAQYGVTVEDRRLQAKLDTPIKVDYAARPFQEIIDDLRRTQGINITVVWNDLDAAGIRRDSPVTLQLANEVKMSKVLTELFDQVGGSAVNLDYSVNNGVLKIAPRAVLDRDTYTVVYPVEDLLTAPDAGSRRRQADANRRGNSPPPKPFGDTSDRSGLNGDYPGAPPPSPTNPAADDVDDEADREARAERVDALINLIRQTIAPDSWRDTGGAAGSIMERGGQLVITQSTGAHGRVRGLLEMLREQSAIQIAIEARFITVTSNYLEELGLDLDVVLNQGSAGYDYTGQTYNGANVLMPRSFSRLGFMPGTPETGIPLTQNTTPVQPYYNAATVPQSGSDLINSSQMSPVPIISNILDLVKPTGTVVPGSYGGTSTPGLQVFGSFLDGLQVDFLLRATQADRRSSVMNAPRLVLTNGDSADMNVSETTVYVSTLMPIVAANNQLGPASLQPVPANLQTGTYLWVRAVASADRKYVEMVLQPEIIQQIGPLQVFPMPTAFGTGFIQLPVTQTQRIRTTVSVPDGGTLLVGGLTVAQEIEAEGGVPVLSKIPVLKRLYSARNLVKDEQVLLILVKPTILIQRETEQKAFPSFSLGR